MAETPSICPHCQAPIGPGTRFCGNCGKSVAPSESPKAAAHTMLGLDAAQVAAATQQARAAAAQPPAAAPA
ncbi:MAG TPA: zinc-ribbon domain-containing protein, partial [Polyangiales bacterium]|nr:zinc-ribbon domain-containing protein [Polyangiales bacterium]